MIDSHIKVFSVNGAIVALSIYCAQNLSFLSALGPPERLFFLKSESLSVLPSLQVFLLQTNIIPLVRSLKAATKLIIEIAGMA